MKRITASIANQGLIIVLVPVVFAVSVLGGVKLLLDDARRQADAEARSKQVAASANAMGRLAFEAGTSLYLFSLSRNDVVEKRYEHAINDLKTEMETLKQLVKPESAQGAAVKRMERLLGKTLNLLDQTQKRIDAGESLSSLSEMGETRRELQSILKKLIVVSAQLVTEEEKSRKKPTMSQEAFRNLIDGVLAAGVVANFALALLLSRYFSTGITSRLNVLTDNSERLARDEELNSRVSGTDEIARLDAAFHKMADDLKEVERMKQSFVSMMSHELRSPLTAVKTCLRLLAEGAYGQLNESGSKSVLAVEKSVSRIISLVNEILDVEKMESGQIYIEPIEVYLDEVVTAAVETLRLVGEQSSISIVQNVPEIELDVDPARFEQVIVNLLSNAIKFSPAGSTIHVDAELQDGSVFIRVKDEGRGIPEAHREAIFKRFHQVDKDDSKKAGGAGLGLAICRAIIEAHSGEISVQSELNKGSTFTMRVPQRQDSVKVMQNS